MPDRLRASDSDGFGRLATGGAGNGMTVLAGALALGAAIGGAGIIFSIWIGFIAATICLLLAATACWRFSRWRHAAIAFVACAAVAFGGSWFTLRQHFTSPHDLAARLGDESTLVRTRGVALTGPVLRHRVGGALARFDYRQPSTYFPMRVETLLDRHGREHEVQGEVLVRVDETVTPFRAGDRVEATGFLLRPPGPRNPGEFDYRELAKSLGQAGFLTVGRRDLLHITPVERSTLYERFTNWREGLRRRAGAWLLADLPQTSRTERDSLLAMFMLGEREEQIDGVYSVFQRVGLAHLLAISGFHLGVLAGFVLILTRLFVSNRRWQGFVVIAFVLLYLMMIETRMPVLRAGLMTMAASLGWMTRRRLHAGGLCSLSVVALLLWRPDQIFNPGFQLTFSVVYGLIYLAPNVRRRLFGRPNRAAASAGQMATQWLWTAISVALTSWMIALPIVMYHFGMISPLGILLSVITVPLAAVLLGLGFLKMVFAALVPSIGVIIGVPLSICSDILLTIVTTVDSIPYSIVSVPNPSAAWTIIALVCVAWWLRGGWRKERLVGAVASRHQLQHAAIVNLLPWFMRRTIRVGSAPRWCCTAAVLTWFFWSANNHAALRIDMLSVGDGSCYLIRSGSSAVVFDAGSSTDLNVARRSLIPALRRLGVASLDSVMISHADLDHYSAALELAKAFNAREVVITPHFQAAAKTDPYGPAAYLLDELVKDRFAINTATEGEVRLAGAATWTWLHPPSDIAFKHENDGSMVVRIDVAGRRVLLCGDIQRDAMERLMRNRHHDLKADVMELPHHGSYHDVAPRFVKQVGASIIMQSTGWSRWSRDRWAKDLSDAERLVTARDGACWVEIAADSTLEAGRFIDSKY